MSTRAHISIKTKEGEYLHMSHHHDGYPDGVGCELSELISEYQGSWDAEDVQKFINNADEDYKITEYGISWDQEYVYVIDCERKVLSCYYKGITDSHEDYEPCDCGDELLIPGNKFSSDRQDKPVEKTLDEKHQIYNGALTRWGIVNQVFMVMEECGELLNVLAKAKRERATKEDIITELADVSIMVEQMAFYYGEEEFNAEKERKLERLKHRVFDNKNSLP